MKIKYGLAIATLLVAGTALAGCSAGGSSTSTGKISGTVTGIFDSNYKTTINAIIKGFEKKYPAVKVNMSYVGATNITNLITTQLEAGTAPDILVTQPNGSPKAAGDIGAISLASYGYLADLSKVSWANKIPATWKDEVSYKGKLYSYPGAVQPLAAIYNQNELDKLGLKIPTTLDQVYALCSAAKTKGVYAYAQGLGETDAGPQMLSFAQTASLIYGPNPKYDASIFNGTATYQSSAWVAQFKIYQKMFSDGCFGAGSLGRTRQQGAQAVASGQALAQVDVGGQKVVMQSIAPKDSFVVAPMPANNSGKNYITALPGYTLGVNAHAKNKAAALAFLNYIGSPAASVIYANGFASVPIIPDSDFKASPQLKQFADTVAAGKFAPLANMQGNKIQNALNVGVQSMLLGKSTPQQVAQQMQSQVIVTK